MTKATVINFPSTNGLTKEQKTALSAMVERMLMDIVKHDPKHRPLHYALFVLTRESVSPDGDDIVTADVASSMGAEHLHEALRDWLHRETQ